MDGQYRHCAYCNPGLVENKEISTNICIKYARFCSDDFCLKFHLNSVMCHSQVSPKETSTSISVTRFLLCFAWNWHLLQAIHEAISTFYCQETWFLLQRSFVALDWFFRFPQDNLESNSCITLMVIWHKIELFTTSLIFSKNSKNRFSRASGSEL